MGRSIISRPQARALERRLEALRLRQAGLTYEQIGRQLGISPAMAYKLVSGAFRYYQTLTAEAVEELRQLELSRLEQLHMRLWTRLWANKEMPTNEEAVIIDRLLRIADMRARIAGLYERAGEQAAPAVIRLVWPEEVANG